MFFSAASGHAAGGGFTKFYNDWLNIPGFEVWKFLNLAIFIIVIGYLVKKPLSDAFRAKRDAIRAELIRAEEAKQAALKQLTAAEARLAGLENEKGSVLKKAREEAEAEKQRIAEQAEIDIEKLQSQADDEVRRLQKQIAVQLRRYSADESLRLAEMKLRSRIDAEQDSRLVKSGISSIGGLS